MAEGPSETARKILRALEEDGRRSPAQVARMVGVAEEEVAATIRHYERTGVIRGYKAVIAWDRIRDDRVLAFIDVSVSPERDVGFDQVAARIYRHSEVRSVHLVSGGHDLRVIVEGTSLREVATFVAEKLAPIEHVSATNTHFLLKTFKEDGRIMAEDVADDDRLAVTP